MDPETIEDAGTDVSLPRDVRIAGTATLNPQSARAGDVSVATSSAEPIRSYVAKLERRTVLPDEDRDAMLALPATVSSYRANETILDQDVSATHCMIVWRGVVSRVKLLECGLRQIVALHISGDAVDLQSILFTKTDHLICTHSTTEVAWVSHADLLRLASQRPVVAKALWLDTLVDASIFREWTANLGQRKAQERTAHLLLEMAARLDAIGGLVDDRYELPLTQTALADALGLSLVHMNKSLQALRHAGYLTITQRMVHLRDRAGLITLAGFNDRYLHIDGSRIKDLRHAPTER